MDKTTALVISDNELTGNIPSSLGMLTELIGMYLDGNKLNGTIPSTLGFLEDLLYLQLNNNQLSGFIPSTLGSLTNIESLYLHSNPLLQGNIHSNLCSLQPTTNLTIYIDCNSSIICPNGCDCDRLPYPCP